MRLIKPYILLFSLLSFSLNALAQTSVPENRGYWLDGTSWAGGTAPPVNATNLQNIVIDGYIIRDGSLISTSNFGLTVNEGDTLVISENLSIQNGNLTINSGGVLLLFGDATSTGNFSISLNGGDLILAGENTSINGITTNGNGHLYVFDPSPSISGNINGSNGLEDESDLSANNPALYNFVTGGDALPVTFLYINANAVINQIELRWATASERDNEYFEIQKSANGTVFTPLGTVSGTGNSHNISRYSFIDRSPASGANYYRIKQVDTDGTSSYSDVLVLFYNTVSDETYLYPNPSYGHVSLYIGSQFLNTPTQFTLIASNGRTVEQRIIFQEHQQPINLTDDLLPGVYYVRLENEFSYQTRKLVVR